MTQIKQPVCCARRTAKLHMDEANLRRLAIKTAARASKGLDITTFVAKIDECKATIEQDKQAVIEHDAEHAAGLA